MENLLLYCAKSSALLIVFYLVYLIFLKKETFFQHNRFFLLGGIFLSLVLPFVTFQKIIWIEVQAEQEFFPPIFYPNHIANIAEPAFEIDWVQILLSAYFIISFVFLIQFISSLWSVRKQLKGQKTKFDKLSIIRNSNISLPFSFFKYIVINEEKFKETEWHYILAHEKIHAQQWHSLDVLFVKIIKIFFWFNPIYWFYEKSVVQNLEFIADELAVREVPNKKDYQKIMLMCTLSSKPLALTNPFYQSLIKKRIVMLNQKKSNPFQQWKFATILPFLAIFIWQFQVEMVAQVKKSVTIQTREVTTKNQFVFQNSSDETLQNITNFFKNYQVEVNFTKIKRNKDQKIISIDMKIVNGSQKLEWKKSGNEPIDGFQIIMTMNEDQSKTMSIEAISEDEVVVITEDDGVFYETDTDKIIAVGGKYDMNQVVKTDNVVYVVDGEVLETEKAKKQMIKAEKIVILSENDAKVKYQTKGKKVVEIQTESDKVGYALVTEARYEPNKKSSLKENIQESEILVPEKALYYLDKKAISYNEAMNIEPSKIKLTAIQKGNEAVKKHGKKAEFGIVNIYTENSKLYKELNKSFKKNDQVKVDESNTSGFSTSYKVGDNDNLEYLKSNPEVDYRKALIILNKKIVPYQEIDKIAPLNVHSVIISGGSEAMVKKYGDKAKNGVIMIDSETPVTEIVTADEIQKTDFRLNKDNDGFIIHKKSTDEDFEFYKSILKKNNLKLKINSIQRNASGEITHIEISLKEGKNVALATWQTRPDGIPEIFVGKRNGKLTVSSSK